MRFSQIKRKDCKAICFYIPIDEEKMTNFNEKINSHKEFVLCDTDSKYFIERIGSIERLKLEFDYISHFLESSYSLFIQYKDTYRVQKMAGRCFVWSCTSNTKGVCNVRNLCLDRDDNEDLDNFSNPRFEYISGAVLISDRGIYAYGDTWFETVGLEKNHILCNVYVCGRMVSEFRIPAEAFDHFFDLKENFPKQYENVFGNTEETKLVQEENDSIDEAKRSIELCKNSLIMNKYRLEKAVDLLKGALEDFDVKWHELDNTLYKLTQKD